MYRNSKWLVGAMWLGALASGANAAGTPPQAAPASAKTAAPDYVLPGQFRADDSLATLQARFGAANAKLADLDGAEGETAPGIVLFGDDPQRRVELFLHDAAKHTGIDAFRVTGTSSRWHLANGVKLGMPLAELVAINGQAIDFSGMGWDYGGNVLDWHHGKLAQAEGVPIFISLTLSSSESAADTDYPSGDAQFRSDDPKYPRLGQVLYVDQLLLTFRRP